MSKKGIFSQDMIQGLGIIQGWREIGRHIGRSGRTARRWHDNYHLPIRYSLTGRPFALTFELNTSISKVDELIKKNGSEGREKDRQHAAYMRSCKKKTKPEVQKPIKTYC
jgi:hypothetical protein